MSSPMHYFLRLGLLLILCVPSLAQRPGGGDPGGRDIRGQLYTADSLGSEGRAVEAIRLLESARADGRITIDPILRGEVHFSLAGAYAVAGEREKAIVALKESISLGDVSYRIVETEKDFDGLRRDPRLRENSGGYTDVAMQVLGLFMDSSFATHQWETPHYSPFARYEQGVL